MPNSPTNNELQKLNEIFNKHIAEYNTTGVLRKSSVLYREIMDLVCTEKISFSPPDLSKYIRITLSSYFANDNKSLKLSLLNIGRGTSVFISSEKTDNILIDFGPDINKLSQRFKMLGIDIFDSSVIRMVTHNHEDHNGNCSNEFLINYVLFNSSGTIIESDCSLLKKFSRSSPYAKNDNFKEWIPINIINSDHNTTIYISKLTNSDIYEIATHMLDISGKDIFNKLNIKIRPKTIRPKKTDLNDDCFITGFEKGDTYFIIPGDAPSKDIVDFINDATIKPDIEKSNTVLIIASHHGSNTGAGNYLAEQLAELNKKSAKNFIFFIPEQPSCKVLSSPLFCKKQGTPLIDGKPYHKNGCMVNYTIPQLKHKRDGTLSIDKDRKQRGKIEIIENNKDITNTQFLYRVFYALPNNKNEYTGSLEAKSYTYHKPLHRNEPSASETAFYTVNTDEDVEKELINHKKLLNKTQVSKKVLSTCDNSQQNANPIKTAAL